jgi:N-acyl-D-aspartate/D-glutamate deacylase
MLDLIIRGGDIIDGSGRDRFNADVGIRDGRIVAVGRVDGEARNVVDATDRIVAPGFIDPHTHFDVQLLWDGQARPALEHGVTTVVPGNCSLSLAPLKAADRRRLVGMFQQIEELPPAAFTEAFEWTWESFAGYRDALDPLLAVNVAPLVGHSVIRLWVMGEAAQQRAARSDEIAAMQSLLRECLEAGAVGMSTSFVDVDEHLHPVPSRWADITELDALAAVLGEYGRMLQVVPEFYATDITLARVDQLAQLSLQYDIPTTFSPLFDSRATPDNVPRVMARVEEQFARGARVWPQVQTRPIDISFSFEHPSLFFARFPTWYRVMRLPRQERLRALRDSSTVDKLTGETGADGGRAVLGGLLVRGGEGAPKHLEGRTLSEIADERRTTPARALIDVSLEHDLNVPFLAAGLGHDTSDRVGPLLAHPYVHIGASDGGAHIQSFSTYGDTSYLLGHFVRDTQHLSLETAIRKITRDTAEIWGLDGRGTLAEGQAADIVVFDADRIDRGAEHAVFDMPGGGMRYVRDCIGMDAVIVNGTVSYADGAYTDVHAGRICALTSKPA